MLLMFVLLDSIKGFVTRMRIHVKVDVAQLQLFVLRTKSKAWTNPLSTTHNGLLMCATIWRHTRSLIYGETMWPLQFCIEWEFSSIEHPTKDGSSVPSFGGAPNHLFVVDNLDSAVLTQNCWCGYFPQVLFFSRKQWVS